MGQNSNVVCLLALQCKVTMEHAQQFTAAKRAPSAAKFLTSQPFLCATGILF